MKTWIILVFPMVLLACGSTEKNESAGQIPAAMACPASQDPAQGCPNPSDAAVPVGATQRPPPETGGPGAGARLKNRGKTIEGRCELRIQGESKPRSCSEVKVMVRSLENGEMRDGVVDGFAVAFTDLNEKSYKLIAQSEEYDLITADQELKPGKRVALKIKAKPRAR